jgi:hypothetical protein
VSVKHFAEAWQTKKKRFHHRQDAFVPDPQSHPVHQGRMVDHVEACLDVTSNTHS